MQDQNCRRHSWESQAYECASCHHGYCTECVIFVRGPDNPPMCVQCALAISGVRAGGRSPRRGWRERRREGRLLKQTEGVVQRSRRQAEIHAGGEEFAPLTGIEYLDDGRGAVGSWASIEPSNAPER